MISLDAMPVVLTDGTTIAWVDQIDHPFALQFNWYPCRSNQINNAIYAKTHSSRSDGPRKTLSLHRLIGDRMGIPRESGIEVDHRDRNTLNDCRTNLRAATHTQNMANRSLQRNNTTGMRGVYWSKYHKRWRVEIKVGGKKRRLGSFLSKDAAAHAYDLAACEAFGEFAQTNSLESKGPPTDQLLEEAKRRRQEQRERDRREGR